MTTQPDPKRDLTWLEPRDQQERCRMLDRYDAALMGAEHIALTLGATSFGYATATEFLRQTARTERKRLLDELEAAK